MPDARDEQHTSQQKRESTDAHRELTRTLSHGNPRIVIVGGGYVGLPMAIVAAEAHCDVTILELDENKVKSINSGDSYVRDVPHEKLRELVDAGRIAATTYPADAYAETHAVLVCVPTPLNKTQDPDVSFVLSAVTTMAPHVRAPVLLSLESTVYPGFTREVIVPTLEKEGLQPGVDVLVAFSPERVDPGNTTWQTKNTPKVVGGHTPACNEAALALYNRLVDTVVPVSSTDAAEMVKILENTFRAVNIGLVNEVAIMSHRLGIDAWEVIDAASTKPFGFMPFYPGPGIGGHCIPVDPFYLSWKLRTLRYQARFIELAGQVNSAMPEFVVDRLADELNEQCKSVKGSKILVVGVAYKPDIDDMRESPALDVLELLRRRGAEVSYVDPHVPTVALPDEQLESLPVDVDPSTFDAAVIVTHHRQYDYERLVRSCPIVLDTRNITRGLTPGDGVRLLRL